MTRMRRLPPAALACLVLTAARVSAQTLTIPAPSVTVEPSRPRPWDYTLGAGLGWDGNIDFMVPNGPGGIGIAPRGGLARTLTGPHGQVRARAGGELTQYPGEENRHRYKADLGVDGTYQQSPATDWRGSAFYGLGYSDSSRILLDQGVSLPVVKVRWTTGTLGLTQKTGAHTALRVEGRYYRAAFDDPGLIDGNSVRGTLALQRQIDTRRNAALEYSAERVGAARAGGAAYLTHFASLQWTQRLSAQSAFLVEGGGSFTPDAAQAGLERKESFFGGASLRRTMKRSSLTLFLRREVTPAFGIGVSRQELRAGMGTTIPFGRAWELRAAATHVRPDATADPQRRSGASGDVFATLVRRLGRRLELSGEARYRRRGAMGTIPMVESFQAGVFLTIPTASAAAIVPAN